MQSGNVIYAKTHADFLNQLLKLNLKSYMRCTYDLKYGHTIWLIRLNGRESKEGWTNTLTNHGNAIKEFYTGDPKLRFDSHKILEPKVKRLVFNVFDSASGKRRYVFCGVFEFDMSSDNTNRVWNKIGDRYEF